MSKRFGGVFALDQVSVTVRPGEVHALVGENGAGKSTLSKIISGLLTADAGRLLVNGEVVSFRSPREALARGIATIAQELAIVPGLSVADNVFLGIAPSAAGFMRDAATRRRFEELAATVGFELPADRPAGSLRTADQQKVEILRALARDASFIVMDEPTAALSKVEAKQLHKVIRSLAQSGKTVLLISHFLSEVLELADTITILRDGKVVRSVPAAQATETSLIEGMLGRSLDAAFPDKRPAEPDAPVVLSVRNLATRGVQSASLDVRAGEILGLAGLVGSGRSELARAIFQDTSRTGTVVLAGESLDARSPHGAIKRGLVMIPESRKEQGLLLERSINENVNLSSLAAVSRLGWISRHRHNAASSAVLEQVTVKYASTSMPVSALSGGNQQKVLFARTVLCGPKVLIADEPTRGVDVGSKREIYDLLVSLAESGLGVIVISSDLEEVLGLAHRVLVMRAGEIVADLSGTGMTEEAVLAAAFTEPTRAKEGS